MTEPTDMAEAAVLGAAILSPRARAGVVDALAPDDFHREAHRIYFETIAAMHAAGDHIDQVTVVMRLCDVGRADAAGGYSSVFDLTDPAVCPHPSAWHHYAAIVAQAAERRRLDRTLRRGLEQLAAGVAPDLVRNAIVQTGTVAA